MKYLKYFSLLLLTANICLAETEEEFNALIKSHSNSESIPVIITPLAKRDLLNNSVKWKWLKLERYAIGYAENENIHSILKVFNKNYKIYQSSLPDPIEGDSLKWKVSASDISGMDSFFEQECRTFLENTEDLEGEITIFSSWMPQKVNCELMVLAFTINKINFKKAKRGRTLVIVKDN